MVTVGPLDGRHLESLLCRGGSFCSLPIPPIADRLAIRDDPDANESPEGEPETAIRVITSSSTIRKVVTGT